MCSTFLVFKAVLKTYELLTKATKPIMWSECFHPGMLTVRLGPAWREILGFARQRGRGTGFAVDGVIMLIDHGISGGLQGTWKRSHTWGWAMWLGICELIGMLKSEGSGYQARPCLRLTETGEDWGATWQSLQGTQGPWTLAVCKHVRFGSFLFRYDTSWGGYKPVLQACLLLASRSQ